MTNTISGKSKHDQAGKNTFKIAYTFKCGVLSTSEAESKILRKILKQEFERVSLLQKH